MVSQERNRFDGECLKRKAFIKDHRSLSKMIQTLPSVLHVLRYLNGHTAPYLSEQFKFANIVIEKRVSEGCVF